MQLFSNETRMYFLLMSVLIRMSEAWLWVRLTTPAPTTAGPSLTRAPVAVQRNCGRSLVKLKKIIGGYSAQHGAWPYNAVISYGGKFICGGVLITPKWVLSAAHCTVGYKVSNFVVILGDHDLAKSESSEQFFGVKSVIRHPRYDMPYYFNNDISLFELNRPAMLTPKVQPACLPDQNEDTPTGTYCYLTGWGNTMSPGYISTVLRQTTLQVISNSDCWKKNHKIAPITDQMMCGANMIPQLTRHSACHGDSGGPFLCRGNDGSWVLQGVVSWGSASCNTTDAYTVFAKVSKFRYWIDSYIQTKLSKVVT